MQVSDLFTSAVTVVVGLVALVVYGLQKRAEKRSAAIVLIMDVRHTEQVITSVLERNTFDIWMGDPVGLVNWDKAKHLFTSDLSSDEFAAFNRFFLAAGEISKAREDMRKIFMSGLEAKAAAVQSQLCALDSSDEDYDKRRQVIIETSSKESHLFDPDEPKARLVRNLQSMGRLTSNLGFIKLKKIAGMKY